jgi:hypothetical protein
VTLPAQNKDKCSVPYIVDCIKAGSQFLLLTPHSKPLKAAWTVNAADPTAVQDHLTFMNKRVAKIIKVATINPANTRIVRCSALGMVNWSAIASSTPGKI